MHVQIALLKMRLLQIYKLVYLPRRELMVVGDFVRILGSTRQGEIGVIVELQMANVYKVRLEDGEELHYNGLSLEKTYEAFTGYESLRLDLSVM
jgi:hypothetical protein